MPRRSTASRRDRARQPCSFDLASRIACCTVHGGTVTEFDCGDSIAFIPYDMNTAVVYAKRGEGASAKTEAQ